MSTRAPPPSGPPPMYAAAGRAFGRKNLRPMVLLTSFTAALWSLIWGGVALADINGDKQNAELQKLVNFDIVLGALYLAVAAIELFGMFAAIVRRASLVRLFVGLSWFVALLVAGAELVRTVVHFTFKNAIIDECVLESQGERVDTSFGFWGSSSHFLTGDEAHAFCNDSWNRMSLSTIIWLILATCLALFYASITHAFYRQLLDPTFARAPSDQVRLAAIQSGGYGRGYVPYPDFNAPTYAPPAGPPPGVGPNAPPYESGRLPGYGSEFAAKKFNDEKDSFDEPHAPIENGSSEVELGRTGLQV